jgi:hypothetical protein
MGTPAPKEIPRGKLDLPPSRMLTQFARHIFTLADQRSFLHKKSQVRALCEIISMRSAPFAAGEDLAPPSLKDCIGSVILNRSVFFFRFSPI